MADVDQGKESFREVALGAEAIVSSDQMQDLVSGRISEGVIYKSIDIQAGSTRMRANDQRVVAMRLQGLSPLDAHSKRSKKLTPMPCETARGG